MRLTYYGQSCVGVHTAGKHLLFDPAINANPLAQGKVDIHAIPPFHCTISQKTLGCLVKSIFTKLLG